MADELTSEQIDMVKLMIPENEDISALSIDIAKIQRAFGNSQNEIEKWYEGLEQVLEESLSTYRQAKQEVVERYNKRVEKELAYTKVIREQVDNQAIEEILLGLVDLRETVESRVAGFYRFCLNITKAYISQENPKNSMKAAAEKFKIFKNEISSFSVEIDKTKLEKNLKSKEQKRAENIVKDINELIGRKTDKNAFIDESLVSEEGIAELEKSITRKVKSYPTSKALLENIEKYLDEINEEAEISLGKIVNPERYLEKKSSLENFSKRKKGLPSNREQLVEYIRSLYFKGVNIKVGPRGGFKISSKYKAEMNQRTLKEIEKVLKDIPNKVVEDINRQLSKESTLKRTNYGVSDVKTSRTITRPTLKRVFKVRDKVRPKAIIEFLSDIDGKAQAYYQAMVGVKCGKLSVTKKEREKRAARLAAIYFQNLVSNTPIDEYYKYTIKIKKAKRDSFEVGVTKNSEEMLQKSIDNISAEEHTYRRTHTPDNDFARGDWILHYRGVDFKAFDTENGQGFFEREDFLEKGDPKSIEKIAGVILKMTEKSTNKALSFSVSNNNKHIKYLEYGGYIHETEAKVGSQYGFEHGVTNKHTYQAPYGFLRLTNAKWNALAERDGGTDKSLLRKGNFKLDVSQLDLKEVEKILKKGGMPTESEIDKVFTRDIRG